MSTSTQTFPAQRGQAGDKVTGYHDHAWREVEGPDQPLLLGMYRCDLCHVVWAL